MVGKAEARDGAPVIIDDVLGGATYRKAMKKARKKRKARKLLERAWASLEVDRLTMPRIEPAARPLALAEPGAGEPAHVVGAATPGDEGAFPWILGPDRQAVRLEQDLETRKAYDDAGPGTSRNVADIPDADDEPVDLTSDVPDPATPPGGSAPLAVRSLNNGTPQTWTNRDLALARKTLLTAGAEAGSWVGAIAGTSNDPADITFNFYLGDGSADYLVGAVTVPAGAGAGMIPAVNLLADATQLPWVSTEGSFTVPAGWLVRFENVTAPAAGTVTLVPFGGDF